MMRLSLLLLFPGALAAQGIISTYAGNGAASFAGDGGPAVSAALNRPVYVHLDGAGSLYISDENNQRIRRVDGAGVITTFAGNGTAGFSGDGGPATAASLRGPTGTCSDAAGNVYINDTLNHRVRRVDRAGNITTYAGDGNTATLNLPIRCAVDANGVLYLAEQGGHRIRRIAAAHSLATVAGNGSRGFSGDGGPASAAVLDNPTAVAVDYAGNVFFSDQGNQRIRRIGADGVITTVAGNGSPGFSGDNGPAMAAQLNFPGGLAVDQAGQLYVADGPNHRVRRLDRNGNIRTLVGNGTGVFAGDGAQALGASLNGAFGISLDAGGNLFIADTLNNRVRRVTALGPLTPPTFTTAGVVNAASFAGGLTPGGLATIFGRDISPANGVLVTNRVPWPDQLGGVSVTVDGVPARLYSLVTLAGQEQISFQAPFTSPSGANAVVVVENNGSRSAPVNVPVRGAQPGVFVVDAARNGAILHADYALVTAARPAARGEVLLMYLTGLGAVNPAVGSGEAGPAQEPFARTGEVPTVTVGGMAAAVSYSGLAPGFVGLYQVNFQVPLGAAAGSVELVVTASGVPGNAVRLEVR